MMCLNRKVIGGLAAAALAVLLFAPSAFGRVLPVLVAVACPLGMLLMMRGATGACQRKEGEAGQAAAGSTPDAAAEIARLRREVEELRAGRTPAAPSSTPAVSASEQE